METISLEASDYAEGKSCLLEREREMEYKKPLTAAGWSEADVAGKIFYIIKIWFRQGEKSYTSQGHGLSGEPAQRKSKIKISGSCQKYSDTYDNTLICDEVLLLTEEDMRDLKGAQP